VTGELSCSNYYMLSSSANHHDLFLFWSK